MVPSRLMRLAACFWGHCTDELRRTPLLGREARRRSLTPSTSAKTGQKQAEWTMRAPCACGYIPLHTSSILRAAEEKKLRVTREPCRKSSSAIWSWKSYPQRC